MAGVILISMRKLRLRRLNELLIIMWLVSAPIGIEICISSHYKSNTFSIIVSPFLLNYCWLNDSEFDLLSTDDFQYIMMG